MKSNDQSERTTASLPKQVIYIAGPNSPDAGDPGIAWSEILANLWRRRLWIAAGTALAMVIGTAYALFATPLYRAQAVLLAREDNGSLGITGELRQLSSLVGLAGIDIGNTDKREGLGILRSKGFASRFVLSNNLVPTLESDSWSLLTGAETPTHRAQLIVDRFFRDVMSVTEDKKSGLVTVAITWKDPAIAADWANGLAAQVNAEMKARALRESERNIRYLTQQLKETEIATIQQSISRLLEVELQKSMVARGSEEFAFRVIDAAVPPARRDSPKRWLIVIASFVAGLAGSIAFVLMGPPLRRIRSTISGASTR